MVKNYQIVENKLVVCPIDQIPHIQVYIAPSESERKFLVNEFKLDEHTLQSALDPDELARLEVEPEHLALILKCPKNYSGKDQFFFKVLSFGMYLFKDKLIIVTAEDVPFFEGKAFNKLHGFREVFLKTIYRTSYHFLEHLKIINMVSDELEQKINSSMENKFLLNLFTLEKSLVYYLNGINSNSSVIEKLKVHAVKNEFTKEQLEYIDDIYIENSQCYRQAEIYSNVLSGLMDARASIVGNNLNVLMKNLNFITISLMVPTLIFGIFSVNFESMPLRDHPIAFYLLLIVSLIAVVGFLTYWKVKKW